MTRNILAIIIGIFLFIGLTSCQPSSNSKPIPCTETSTSVKCLLALAQMTLDASEDPFVWASGASELAVAYDVDGQTDQAVNLIEKAIGQAETIEDINKRGVALGEILTAIAAMTKSEKAESWNQEILELAPDLEARAKAEIVGKAIVVEAIHGNANAAFSNALNLPQEEDVQGYAKAITLRKIATILAKNGDLDGARDAINSLTMSIDYYKAMVRSDVARIAHKKDDKDLALTLLQEADPIARSLGNGYFVGAALRDIGFSYQRIGMPEKAKVYFDEALENTTKADKQNEKARSTSRLATRLSDAGLSSQTRLVLETAVSFADTVESDVMKSYSFYEIAGSAGISGQFELAKKWLNNVPDTPMGSTSSLRSAAERDLAWGLARYGKTQQALIVARNIQAPREKIHALSRMIRVMKNPDMDALPRYL